MSIVALHTCIPAYIPTYIPTRIHACIHIYIHMYRKMNSDVQSCSNVVKDLYWCAPVWLVSSRQPTPLSRLQSPSPALAWLGQPTHYCHGHMMQIIWRIPCVPCGQWEEIIWGNLRLPDPISEIHWTTTSCTSGYTLAQISSFVVYSLQCGACTTAHMSQLIGQSTFWNLTADSLLESTA